MKAPSFQPHSPTPHGGSKGSPRPDEIHIISAAGSGSMKEANFGHLYSQFNYFSNFPKVVAIVDGLNVDGAVN